MALTDPCNGCENTAQCIELGYCAYYGDDLIERAIAAGLLDLAHAAIVAMDALTDPDLEDPDLEPACDDDDDGRTRMVVGYNGTNDILAPNHYSDETLWVYSYCPCCGAQTESERMAIL